MIIEALTTGVGLAMDAFAVSITNGMSAKRIRPRHALLDGLTFGLFQAAMPLIGLFLGMSFKKYITPVDHWVAVILLAGIGINMIRGALKGEEDEASENPFCFKNMIVQGIATSIDALAVGIGLTADLADMKEAYFMVAMIGICTFLISAAGVYIGRLFGGMLRDKAQIFGGLILIGIGLKILIEHLICNK